MTVEKTGRRQRRLTSQRLFDELADDYPDSPGVDRATMFGP